MRVLWAACGMAVAASALTGVLVGVYLHGMDDGQKAEPPASTWITSRSVAPATTSGQPSGSPTTEAASAPKASTAAPKATTPTTTEAPPPPPAEITTPPPPPPSPTTTTPEKGVWPCHPLNLNPPPQCRD